MNPFLIVFGLFGYFVQAVVLSQVVSEKTFKMLSNLFNNVRLGFYSAITSIYLGFVLTSSPAFWNGLFIGLALSLNIMIYSVIFWIAKYKRDQILKDRRKKK